MTIVGVFESAADFFLFIDADLGSFSNFSIKKIPIPPGILPTKGKLGNFRPNSLPKACSSTELEPLSKGSLADDPGPADSMRHHLPPPGSWAG